MSIRWDKVQVDGKTMGVYTAVPDMPGPLPCVVVAQHGPGHDNTIQDVVQRLHREGYVAVAPALYHRQPKEVDPKISRVTLLKDNEVIADMNAALAHAKSGDPALIAGYCGNSDDLDEAIAKFALAYAKQTDKDYEALDKARRSGRIRVASEAMVK